ncbi:MAG: hypothetical protein VYB24_08160, partial [Pseudomonadota bacterium]|nr:hypothetical protein [Pseudomonadota bacterium]
MNITSNPSTVHPPLGQYAHVVEVPDNARWLVISGQVGIDRSAGRGGYSGDGKTACRESACRKSACDHALT